MSTLHERFQATSPRMATISHAITTTAVSSGEEHARIVLNLGEPHRPAIDMTSSGASSRIPPSTCTDSGYASMTDGSPRSFCKGSIEGIAVPGSKLWSQKVKLKVFSKPLSEAAENRFADLMEFIPKGLEEYILRARLAVKPYSIILKSLGEDEATAKPWIFIQCDKALTRKIKQFFKQDHIKSEYHPTLNDELQPSFRVFLCERPPRKIAATDTVDVYAQSHFGLASSASCRIKVIDPSGSSRVGTLGGLIKITAGDGNFNLFGMTARHIFASDDLFDDESELHESMDEDTDEDEYSSTYDEEVVELDLGSRDDGDSISNQGAKITMGTELEDDDMPTLSWTKMGRLQDMSVNTIDNGMNFDWALITIDDLLLYHGIIGTDFILTMQENAELKEPLELTNQRRSSQAVTLCGGTSGTKEGILSVSWSYLQLSPGKALVRTYTLTLSDHTELRDGDCGAWVIGKTTHELYGHVVALGLFGEAYVVPIECSFENIRRQLGAKSVCLPQPQEVTRWLQRVIETRERIRERSPSPVRVVRERIVEREREVRQPSRTLSQSPSQTPIWALPTQQEITTQHRHIDHGYESAHASTPSPPPHPQDVSQKRKVSTDSAELIKSPAKRTSAQQFRPKEEYSSSYEFASGDTSPAISAHPQLIRTSTLQQTPSPTTTPHGNSGQHFNAYALYPHKAKLEIQGDLDAMAQNWTPEEFESRRRLVQFRRSQSGSTITTTFAPISAEDRPPQSVCISCIYWEEKQECFVTSVDLIYLLEQLVAARFTVEEKNRIRRNLEGFRPMIVSKGKADFEEFFKVIMAFPAPKPRNIEKDVKVFHWKELAPALKKIIGKYSAMPSSIPKPDPLTPVSSTGSRTRESSTSMSYVSDHHGAVSRHESSGHWQGEQLRLQPSQYHQLQMGISSSRSSWDMSTHLESNPTTAAGTPAASQQGLNYSIAHANGDSVPSGADNGVAPSLSSQQQSPQMPRA